MLLKFAHAYEQARPFTERPPVSASRFFNHKGTKTQRLVLISVFVSLWLILRAEAGASSLGFVRNEVAGEEFDHAFCGAHHRRHVQAHVHGARK